MITRLEHFLLGTATMGWEPVHVMYKENRGEGYTFVSVIEALVNLFNLGYVECRVENHSYTPVESLTKEGLLEHYGSDLSEKEINIYPNVPVHEFRATPEGREEYKKSAYKKYYHEHNT